MFDHVTIRAADREASDRFYATVLATLGVERAPGEDVSQWGDLRVAPATSGRPVTRRLHVGFVAPSHAHVDAFWRAGTEAGHRDDGAPGPRPQYRADYYGAFLLDPDGNSAEAVHHGGLRSGGGIDHLWIRVADLAAARRFYETIGPCAGLGLRAEMTHLARFAGARGSFTLVAGGAPTEHVHMAFAVPDGATVDAFHRTAIAAGYRDDGAPGERPGGYGASVLDPDANVAEVIHREREAG